MGYITFVRFVVKETQYGPVHSGHLVSQIFIATPVISRVKYFKYQSNKILQK